MKATQITARTIAAIAAGASMSVALAQDQPLAQRQPLAQDQPLAQGQPSAQGRSPSQSQPQPQQSERPESSIGLVREVRQATQRFQDPRAAIAAGYVSTGNCVSGPNQGAMGVHYVNEAYIADGRLDIERPDVLVYEPREGQLRLAAIEFFVDAKQWDAANAEPPVIGGQLLNYVGSPNRLRAPAYYELHVWAWKRNPSGIFSDWNPGVSCSTYTGEAEDENAGQSAAPGHLGH